MTKEEYEAKKLQKRRCSNCEHSRINPQDMNSRICRGAPPSIVMVPIMTARGQALQQQAHYPVVGATDEGCGTFKPKLLIDNNPPSTLKQ